MFRLIKKVIALSILFALVFSIRVASNNPDITKKTTTIKPIFNLIFGQKQEVPLAGTGSMYPTLYWDEKEHGPENYEKALAESRERVLPKLYYHIKLNYKEFSYSTPKVDFGDIVAFEGQENGKEQYFIKRIIGKPGDTIQIRDGYVIRNGEKIKEPYIHKARSTFGGKAIPECKDITIPDNKYLVLGDNRKVSFDSRQELGFIDKNNINFILPFNDQENLKSTWRDTSQDDVTDNKVTLNADSFIKLVNEFRKEKGLKPYTLNTKLNKSATNRADFILTNNKFEIQNEKGQSYFPIEMQKVGYFNVLTAEYLLEGYYESDELLALSKESKDLEELLLSQDYQDVGVGTVNKNVNGCPKQVIVIHMGGYKSATYTTEVKQSWQRSVSDLTESSRTWKSARGDKLYTQDKLEELLRKYERAIQISQIISNKINQGQWLSPDDEQLIKEQDVLLAEIEKLARELNKQAQRKL